MRRWSRTFRAEHPSTCDRCAQPILMFDVCKYDEMSVIVHADCENPRGLGDPE